MSTQSNIRIAVAQRVGRYMAVAAFAVSAVMMQPAIAADGAASAPSAPAGAMPQQKLSPEQLALMQDFQKTRQSLVQTGNKLAAIEKKAYDKNPALGKQRDKLRDAIRKKMTTKDYDAQARYDELRALVKKIQGEKGDQQARQKDIMDFRQKQQAFVMRQHEALQDKGIQKMVKDLRGKVRAEMLKMDPKSKELFAQMDKDEKHMKQLQQKAMAMHGSMQKAPAK